MKTYDYLRGDRKHRGLARAGPALWRAGPVLLAGLFLATPALAQTTFSIDFRGPTKSAPDAWKGTPITEGDVLGVAPTMTGPGVRTWPYLATAAPPQILISGGPGPGGLGLPAHPGAVGLPPGIHGNVEVDALSFGRDGPAQPADTFGNYWWSVDGAAFGFATPSPPTVFTEGALVGAGMEASADIFVDLGILQVPPIPPFAIAPANTGAIDGDGFPSATGFAYPGLGLREPNPFPPPPPADGGDNLDAADVDGPQWPLNDGVQPYGSPLLTYFSLDGVSAPANGPFVAGDVLVSRPGGPPIVFAPAPLLGLDLVGGPNSDDLDAVAVFKVVPGGTYFPSLTPFDWLAGSADMVLFSVRAGSAVIGAPDSIFNVPIEAGDILTTPLVGGPTPFPGIFIAAENLGLATLRSGFNNMDELDALDVLCTRLFDCDNNGQEDALDIAFGVHTDFNQNGVPDPCEIAGALPDPPYVYCSGKTNTLNCIPFMSYNGTPSVSSTNPFFTRGNDVVPGQFGLLIYGFKRANLNFHGGKLCVKAPFSRTPAKQPAPVPWGCTGAQLRRNFNKTIQSGTNPLLTAGIRVVVQWFQRDPGNPSGFSDNLTDGMGFLINP